MALLQTLKSLVNKQLNRRLSAAAAEEIFEIVGRIITEYEDQAFCSKQEIDRQRRLLDMVLKPNIKLHRSDSIHPSVLKQEVSLEQQEWNPSLVQEVPDPPQIKEEQEDVHQRPEDVVCSPQTLLAVKSEDDGEHISREREPLASTSIGHMKIQAGVEYSGALQSSTDVNMDSSHCSKSDTEDSDEWEDNMEDQANVNTLQSHKTQSAEERFPVSHKPSKKISNQTLKKHMMTHTGEKPYSCKVCGKGFNLNGNLKQHMTIHTEEMPFSCTVCGKGFNFNSHLKQHMIIHTGKRAFQCTICATGFFQNTDLRKHMMTHTGAKPHSCKVCSKGFVYSNDLKKHMLIHTGEKPYSCTTCGKGFNLKGNLKKHMMIHTGEKPFPCTLCAKGFYRNHDLKKHILTHTGEKSYSCTVCGKAFNHNTNLKQHMTIHTEDKPFSCTVCGKCFRRNGQLKTHIAIHTGEKPYSCTVCGKSFIEMNRLKKHLTIHTMDTALVV